MTPHQRRLLKTFVSALFVLFLAGVTYQGVATALERRTFKYPGRMVPVGDHQLHLQCEGQGAPTVVLEAPALGFSASWSLVQGKLATTTRVCAYDRAGLGWSEASEGPFDARRIPDDLHTLLMGAGERTPYLLVGDGLGTAYVTHFAAQFPGDTAALVLFDVPQVTASTPGQPGLRTAPSPWLARTGILRLSRLVSSRVSTLPGPPDGPVAAFSMRPDHLTRGAQEIQQLNDVVTRANALTLSPDLPVRRIDMPTGSPLLATEAQADDITRIVSEAVRDWQRQHSRAD